MKNTRLFFPFFAVLIATVLLSSCKDSTTNVNVSKPQVQIGKPVSDTLDGSVNGTMLSGHTYYFKTDVRVNAGDTLLMQKGSKLIVLPNPALTATPELFIFGTFISLGTKDQPNWITAPDNSPSSDSLFFTGKWGGIQGSDSSGDIVLKWTHLEFVGGPSGNGDLIYKVAGKTRYGIQFQSVNHNFIMEDCWMRGVVNDGIRTVGGHISIMRNTFEFGGKVGGESINVKGSTLGDIAYNLFIGNATNGPKLANDGAKGAQTNVNIYNNTIVNCGWRMTQSGRSGSTDIEAFARGSEYNNLIVNCRTGFRLISTADIPNVKYDYIYYYGQADTIVVNFYPSDGVQVKQAHDIAGKAKENDPMFVGYDVNQFDFTSSKLSWPVPLANEPRMMNEQGTSDFHLRSGSPVIGKGYTGFQPLQSVSIIGGDFGATITPPGKDIGAYQFDGTGNQH